MSKVTDGLIDSTDWLFDPAVGNTSWCNSLQIATFQHLPTSNKKQTRTIWYYMYYMYQIMISYPNFGMVKFSMTKNRGHGSFPHSDRCQGHRLWSPVWKETTQSTTGGGSNGPTWSNCPVFDARSIYVNGYTHGTPNISWKMMHPVDEAICGCNVQFRVL